MDFWGADQMLAKRVHFSPPRRHQAKVRMRIPNAFRVLFPSRKGRDPA